MLSEQAASRQCSRGSPGHRHGTQTLRTPGQPDSSRLPADFGQFSAPFCQKVVCEKVGMTLACRSVAEPVTYVSAPVLFILRYGKGKREKTCRLAKELLLQLRSESSPRDSLGPRSSYPSSHHHTEQVLPWVRVPWSIPRMPFSQAAMESEALRASSSQICILSHPGSLVNAQKKARRGVNTTAYFLFSLISRV